MTILSNVKNRGSFVAALTVAAVIAAMAYAKVSKAWDQQAPDDQMSAELSHRILDWRHYSSGPYASANARARDFRGGTSVPYAAADCRVDTDFQLQGRSS